MLRVRTPWVHPVEDETEPPEDGPVITNIPSPLTVGQTEVKITGTDFGD